MIPKPWIDQATTSAKDFYDNCKRPDLNERDKMLGALMRYQMSLDAQFMVDKVHVETIAQVQAHNDLEKMLVDEAIEAYDRAFLGVGKKPGRLGMLAAVRRVIEKLWITAINEKEQADAYQRTENPESAVS